jgi:hypothetical protein
MNFAFGGPVECGEAWQLARQCPGLMIEFEAFAPVDCRMVASRTPRVFRARQEMA